MKLGERLPDGGVGGTGIAEARLAADATRLAMRNGSNPVQERREERQAAQAEQAARADTLARLLGDYAGSHEAKEKRSHAEADRRIKSVFATHLSTPLADLTAVALHRTAEAWKAPKSAAAAIRYLRPILKWGAKLGRVGRDVAALEVNVQPGKRDRVLSGEELALLLPALLDDTTPYGAAHLFMLYTLARREEVAGMTWSEVKGDSRTIPAERAKNRTAHAVTLPRQAVALIGERGADDAPVFHTRTGASWAATGIVRQSG